MLRKVELVLASYPRLWLEVLPGETLEFGRGTLARVGAPSDPHVSARHFAVVCGEEECRLRDLGSTNGTYLNHVRVDHAIIQDGDQVQVGGCVFTVRVWNRRGDAVSSAPTRAGLEHSHAAGAAAASGLAAPGERTPANRRGLGDPEAVAGGTVGGQQLFNESAFRVSTTRWVWPGGTAGLTVVVKATFTIGEPPAVAPEQVPIFAADVGGAPPGTVRFESDLAPFKPRTDIVVVGHAYAPEGQAITHLLAGLSVDGHRFMAAVIGDRRWEWQAGEGPVISPATPFTRMALDYERSFGGVDAVAGTYCAENLIGTGFAGQKLRRRLHGLALPNLEDPNDLVTAWDSRPKPVGFGFYGRGWMPRLAFARALGEAYGPGEARGPLPARFFNGAHPALQIEGHLRGDEEIELLNLCATASRVRFRLPGVVPRVRVSRWQVPPEAWTDEPPDTFPPLVEETVTPKLDTLVFVPDENVFYEVFRGVCRLMSAESLEIARITVSV